MSKYIFFCAALILTTITSSFSQSDYLMKVTNGKFVNENAYQFDVFLKSTGTAIEITSYQCVFTFFCNDQNDDDFAFSYVAGSSKLSNQPMLGVSVNHDDGKSELTFASSAGLDNIGKDYIKVGTFLLERENNSYKNSDIYINWDFEGNNSTILTGKLFNDITNPDNHLSDINSPTAVEDTKLNIPDEFQLDQNYPNPFNPSTKIRFYLKENGNVKLEVFNLLGQKIAGLIDENMSAGYHEVDFNSGSLNGENMASGIYVYRINVENKFTAVKKMILQK